LANQLDHPFSEGGWYTHAGMGKSQMDGVSQIMPWNGCRDSRISEQADGVQGSPRGPTPRQKVRGLALIENRNSRARMGQSKGDCCCLAVIQTAHHICGR
jgi:hypothetical protein